MSTLKRIIQTSARGVFRARLARKAAFGLAARRHGRIVLLYHRIADRDRTPEDVVPTIRPRVFREHLEALSGIGDIVPLARLLSDELEGTGIRFAITFDDDHTGYVAHALPVLQALDVTATFFLSGRSLHGLGPYWFELLEQAVARRGLKTVADALGLAAATAPDLAALCEPRPQAVRVESLFGDPDVNHPMTQQEIKTLSDAGMEIGFHTLHHPLLTVEDDARLADAMREGRDMLQAVTGKPTRFMAYPYGKADLRVAAATRHAGFEAAFTNRGYPIGPGLDRFLLGRLDVQQRGTPELLEALALHLNLPARTVHE